MENSLSDTILAGRVLLASCSVLLGTVAGCGESRPCTEEEMESGNTLDCTADMALVTYTARSEATATLSKMWRSGLSLRLEGAVRELTVVEGPPDRVELTYRAQVDLAEGRSESFVQATMDELEVDFEERGDVLRFEVGRADSKARLGAIVSVGIPKDFDGDLVVQKLDTPGDVFIDFLGMTRELDVDMEAPDSTLSVQDTRHLQLVRLNAAGSVETSAFAGSKLEQVVINSEAGDIVTAFDVVPRSHATLLTGRIDGDKIKDTGGNIEVGVPKDGNFTLATYTNDEARFFGAAGCRRVKISRAVEKLVCGSGDEDGMLTFEVKSSQNVTIELE